MRIKEVKDLLSLCFQKETDIMRPEREGEHPLGSSLCKKTKSFTRPNWTPAFKIPEQRGIALLITNLNIEVPSEHQNHIYLLHI
jgi:hypothetical protein